jgi:uncharacterized protein (TIGR02996 family)
VGRDPVTERETFLAAIREAGADDTPRLVYADWLDEFGTTDADAARAEFIRLSCTTGKRKGTGVKVRSGVKEGRWLDENWHRLLPSLAATATPKLATTGGLALLSRRGGELTARWHFGTGNPARPYTHYHAKVSVRYWKGFAVKFSATTVRHFLRFAGPLARDEPLAQPGVTGDIGSQLGVLQDPYGDHIGCYASAARLGPIYPLVEGFDEEQDVDATGGWAKLFTTANQRDADEAYEAGQFQVQCALERWVAANAGRSFEWWGRERVVEVTFPLDYSTDEWREQPEEVG